MEWSSCGSAEQLCSEGDTGRRPYDYLGLGMCWRVRILQLKTTVKKNLRDEDITIGT